MSVDNEIDIKEGIRFHKINTNKYKTNLLAIYLTDELTKENITKNALIISILRRGTNNLKSQEKINIKLEELYGAEFNCGIDKIGNDTVFKFYIESLNDKYAYSKDEILKNSVNILFDIIFNPLIENEKFNDEYFKSEKENLRQIIQSRKDNKASYAYSRCIEEMYKDDPYGLYLYGNEEELDKITNKELYKTYKEMIKKCKIDIFLSGNFEKEDIDEIIKEDIEKYNLNERDIKALYLKNENKLIKEEKIIKEHMDVTQGKLVIGLDLCKLNKEEKIIASVYNAILGGGANSKLFQNVREKASLAYSAGSLYIKTKNNIIIKSGIEAENYEKALEIIKKQIEDIKNGEFNEVDINNAKKILVAGYKSMQDEQDSEIAYLFGKEIEQDNITVEDILNKIENVTKEEIMRISQKVYINTIYFLSK